MTMIPTFGEEGLAPGAYSGVARRLGVLSKRVRVLMVLADRIILAADWETIGRHLGLPAAQTAAVFAEMETRWRAGDPAPWAPVFTAVDMTVAKVDAYPLDIPDLDLVAAQLDRFCHRHIYPSRDDRGPRYDRKRQVSAGLPG